ncbi:MAG: DUF4351 domain-containing protein [Gemmataceae bacterium]
MAWGRQEERQKLARSLLERKFGPLSEAVTARLAALPAERLNDLLLAILDAPSLQALGLAEDVKQPRNRRTKKSNR